MKLPRILSARISAVLAVATTGTALMLGRVTHAAMITKANNTDNLDLPTSWVGNAAPTAADIALWDASVTAANTVNLGVDLSWHGLKIADPAGQIAFNAGNTLTLGAGGLDMSTATQNLVLSNNVALLANRAQSWSVNAGRALSVSGILTRGTNATLNIDAGAGSTINIGTGVASALVGAYATLNKSDFAALDASLNVVPGSTVLTYTQNPLTDAALPNMSGTVTGVLDVVNSNTNATSAFRLSNTLTVTGGGVRFNTPHANGQDWTVDINTRNFNVGNQGILVTAAVGVSDVIFNGSSGNIRLGTGSELLVHQHNTVGDLIFNAQVTQPAGAGARLTKSGAGRLILANNFNSYAGGTFIQDGTVQVGNGGTAGVLGAGDVTNYGTLAFNRSDPITVVHNILGTGAVTQMGPGELNFTSNVSTYSGPTNLNGGTLAFLQASNLGTGAAVNFNGGGLKWAAGNVTDLSATKTLSFNAGNATIDTNGNTLAFANPIGNGGAGTLVKAGAGTLSLAAANNYAGGTVLNAGALLVMNTSGSATGSGNVDVNTGGTIAGTGTIAGPLKINGGGVLAPGNNGVGSITVGALTLATDSILNFEFSPTPANDFVTVTVADGLTINGGKFNFVSEGTSTPWTTVGTYNLLAFSGSIQGLGVGGLSLLNEPAGFDYAFGVTNSRVTVTITTEGLIRNWVGTGGGSWGNAANWNGSVPNEIGATVNFGNSITARSTVTLDGNKTVGAITFNSAQSYIIAQGTSGSLTIQKNSGTGQGVVVSGNHTISAPLVLGSDLIAEVATGGQLTVSGNVSGASRSLTKIGGGTLVLSGANTYDGATQVDAGTIVFNALAGLGTGTQVGLNGGTLRWAENNEDLSIRTVTIGAAGATFDTNGNDVVFASAVGNSGTGGLTKAGDGTLTLAQNNTFSGPTTISGGTLSVSSNDSLGNVVSGAALVLNGGKLAAVTTFSLDNFGANARPVTVGAAGGAINVGANTTLTIPGSISGSGPLTKSGTGVLTITSNNSLSFSGPVTLAEGEITLAATDLSNAGLGTGAITFNGGTLTLNGHLGSTTPTYGALANPLIVPAGQAGAVNMAQRGSLTGGLSGGGTFNLKVNYVRGDVTANWNGFTGQVFVTSTNTGDGNDDFRLANFATLNIPAAKLNLGEGVSMLQVFNPPSGGTLESVHIIGELTGGVSSFIGGSPVAGRFTNWTIGALNTDSTFAGTIANSAGDARLTKVGTGTLTLSGISTFLGATTINAGTLLVNGSISGSTTTVNGGVLGGTGTVGSVIVNPAAVLAPGAGIESLDILGTLTMNPASTFALEFDTTTVTADLANVSGLLALDLSNTVVLSVNALGANTALPFGTTFTFIDYTDAGWNGGIFAGLPDDSAFVLGPNEFRISYNGVDDVTSAVTLQVIPEPSSAVLLSVAGSFLSLRRRKRRD